MGNDKLNPQADQVIWTDRWSRYQWERFLESTARGREVVERGEAKLYSFPRFARELFHRLFADAAVRTEAQRPEDQWAINAHEELGQMPDFDRLKRRCRGDRLMAGNAALAFAESVLDKLPDPPRPLEDPQPLREQVRGLMAFANRAAEQQGQQAQEQAQQAQKLAEQVRQRGREAVQAAVEYANGIDPTNLRQALRTATKAGHEVVDETTRCVDAFCGWGTGPGTPDTTPIDIKTELAARVSNSRKLQDLAAEAGRLRRIAAAKQRSKADHARSEVTDIERGADLDRLLPSELVKLTDPVLSAEFTRGFTERTLLQYRLTGKEPQGRGPIVVCIDQSSSMEGAKEVWSKAVALALLQVAAMQRRTCRVVHFNRDVVRVDDWRPGQVSPLDLLASMEPFYGGGTSFEPPLRSSLKAIAKEPDLKRADVVLITDGEAELTDDFAEEWRRARAHHGFTCYAVHVEAPGGVAPIQLRTAADTVIGLADLSDDSAATDAILSI